MGRLVDYVYGPDRRRAFPIGGPCRCGCAEQGRYSPEWLSHHAESWDSPFVLAGIDDTTMCAALAGTVPPGTYAREYYRTYPIDSIEAVQALNKPDPLEEPSLVRSLQTISAVAEWSSRPVLGCVWGPLTVAATLGGADGFLRALITQPSLVEELIRATTRATARYASAALDAGAEFLWIAEPVAALFSPQHFREHGLDALSSLVDVASRQGTDTIIHVCGDTSHLTELLAETGAAGLSVDGVVDLVETSRRAGDDVVIMGNLWPLELAERSVDEIAQCTRAMLESMSGRLYIPATGCSCPPGTLPDHLAAFIDAVAIKEMS